MDLKNSLYIQCITKNEQTFYQINHPAFKANISAYGAQLLSFEPNDQQDLLWLSNSAVQDGSKAIRGGVPICWPWFGPASGKFEGEPQHGYLRNLNWRISSIDENAEGVTIEFELQRPEKIVQLGLAVKIIFILNAQAEIKIVTTNLNKEAFELSQAIHTYFNVEDIETTSIASLKGCLFLDKLVQSEQENQTYEQSSELTVNSAMDRVYIYNKPKLEITTDTRTIKVEGEGHDSVIVWNPWAESAQSMADFDDSGYKQMLCVEMGLTQGYLLNPGDTYVLSQRFYC